MVTEFCDQWEDSSFSKSKSARLLFALLINNLIGSFSVELPNLNVSYKPQQISPKSTCTVRQLLHNKIRESYVDPQFVTDVMKPLKIPDIFDSVVRKNFLDTVCCKIR